MKKKRVLIDNNMENHLNKIIVSMRNLGIKNIQRPDAIRVMIKMNEEANLRINRKKKSKEVYFE
ncbi:MAG: hypothetical protein KJ847_02440 [Firmicutes bacterium]|nr:hypothetical protein [Bacillota bacterium]